MTIAHRSYVLRLLSNLRRFQLLEIPAVVVLVLATAVRSLATEDLNFWDETNYLQMGLSVGSGEFASFSAGPTYGHFYFAISNFVGNPVDLYLAGRAGAAALLVVAVWFSARILSGPLLAWTAGAAIAVTPAPYAWPGVATPAAAAIITGCAVMLRWRNLVSAGAASGLFWLAAGSRPEFSWLALVMTATVVVWAGVSLSRNESGPVTLGRVATAFFIVTGSIAVPIILSLLHGSPFTQTGRQWVAFGQHFSQRTFAQGEDPWLDWEQITARSFPNANGVFSALSDNPTAFAWHIVSNVRATPRNFVGETLGITSTPALVTTITGLVGVSLVSGLLLAILVQPRAAKARAAYYLSRLTKGPIANRITFVLIMLTAAAAILPITVISPRVHYLVFPSAVLIVGLVVAQAKIGSSRYSSLLPVSAVMLLFLMHCGQTYFSLQNRVLNPPILASSAKALAEESNQWQLLGVDPGLEVYVPNLDQVFEVDTTGVDSFASLLQRERINAVLVNPRLEMATWSQLDGFENFIEDPARFGFRQITPGSPVWVNSET